jgi:hypothetical protein
MADQARRLADFLFRMPLVKIAPRLWDEAPGMICQLQEEWTESMFGLLPLLSPFELDQQARSAGQPLAAGLSP